MENEKEQELNKLRGRLFKKPNPFEWSKYSKESQESIGKYINENPYECDECGDTYNKNDLIKFGISYVCKNCTD